MPSLPDYKLRCLHKPSGKKGELGAAWVNRDLSVTIVVNPGSALEFNPDMVYTLFPNTAKADQQQSRRPVRESNITSDPERDQILDDDHEPHY